MFAENPVTAVYTIPRKEDFELNYPASDAKPLQKRRSARIASRGSSSSMEVPSNPAPRPTRSKIKAQA